MVTFREDRDLLPYNTFHFSCIARYFCIITTAEDLKELILSPIYQSSTKKLILGGGSNMLFGTQSYDGLVIKNEISGRTVIEEGSKIIIEVGSGESRNELVRWTIEQQWVGLENLVSIPGSVGAVPVQNIGAYGVEAKESIISVSGRNLASGEEKTFSATDCQFGYRDSIFKDPSQKEFFITSVRFGLEKYDRNTYTGNVNYEGVAQTVQKLQEQYPDQTRLRCVATAIAEIRASKLPDLEKTGSAGSFFQNPVTTIGHYEALLITYPTLKGRTVGDDKIKLSAGQLIEMAGYKGHTQNNVGVYEKHALVLVNHGNENGEQLIGLIERIIETVQQLFSIQLVPEVIIIS